jgi:glucose-1-phosphate thymidylyltransferase
MQAVFVCGGKGKRLMPRHSGPKCLVPLGELTLLERLLAAIRGLGVSMTRSVVIVDAADKETRHVVTALLPGTRVVIQPEPDGVANALLLAQPFLDDVVIVALGDLFIDGIFASIPQGPALTFWDEALELETRKNFGITIQDGSVTNVIESPRDPRGLLCGMGVYMLTQPVISCLRRTPVDPGSGERGITAGLQVAIELGIHFSSVRFRGYYNNINTPSDVLAAKRHIRRTSLGTQPTP